MPPRPFQLVARRCSNLVLVAALLTLLVTAAPGQEAKSKVVEDTWDAVYIRGQSQAYVLHGYVHTTIEQRGTDEEKLLRGTQEMKLTFQRDGQKAELRAEQGTEERPDGVVTAVFFQTGLGRKLEMKRTGRLVGKKMEIKTEGPNTPDRELDWNPKVVGLAREQNLLRDKKVKSGESFTYYSYQPAINNVATVKVAVKDIETTELPGSEPRKLLRVELRPEALKINENGGEPIRLQLPGATLWVEPDSYKPVKSENEVPGLPKLILVRTTKEVATAAPGQVIDFIAEQSIRLREPIKGIHAANAVTYRITLRGEGAEVKGLVREDGRQQLTNVKGKIFDLHVEALRKPESRSDVPEKRPVVGDEYRGSNTFITSDDPKVRELAREAVGDTTGAWKKAQRIERWVHDNMKPVDYGETLATAAHVAHTLSGDCTEYAMLAAAMCRAEEIPSRTAVGLVYVDHARLGPVLAFHMWTEVFVQGQWLALDATQGKGSVGPGHIKITDHHWNKTEDFSPLLPVMSFLQSKPSVEVISYRRAE
jgi:transglutaminase-like putative cysteine protease